jgi:D-alanyl-D-alanine carboxypeptidase (penicillin-binding protein 5/6)
VGQLTDSPDQRPLPIASLAKIMTAYVVLHDHPLSGDADGPGVTITPDDVAAYQTDVAQRESTVKVTAGEVLSERQELEGLLVASGNDIAGSLARWDAGNVAAFVAKMNTAAAGLGLTQTRYTDPSGLDPATVSIPADQLRLAEAAMADPTFAAIVAEPQVALPGAGTLFNYNYLIGHAGVVGVKTGSTIAAGGCLAIAARRVVAGHPQLVYAVVLGQRGPILIQAALSAGRALVDAASAAVRTTTLLEAGQLAADVIVPWGSRVRAVSDTALQVPAWGGMAATVSFEPRRLGRAISSGEPVGTLVVGVGSHQTRLLVRAASAVHPPSLLWRLRRLP